MSPTLISKSYKGHKRWYIVENARRGEKNQRTYLETVGEVPKAQARAALNRFIASERPTDRRERLRRFDDIYAEFLDHYRGQVGQTVTARTVKIFEGSAKHFLPTFKRLEIDAVDFHAISEFTGFLIRKVKLSSRYVNMVTTDLKKVLAYARDVGIIKELPRISRMSNTRPPQIVTALSDSDLATLLSSSNERQTLYIMLMVYSGMRPIEAIRLTWDDVDFESGTINVVSENSLKRGRLIPMHEVLRGILLNVTLKAGMVCPYETTEYARKSLSRLAKRVGVPCNPYRFRKTFGTLLAQRGVEAIDIAALMGHTSLQTTYKFYLKLSSERLGAAMSKL